MDLSYYKQYEPIFGAWHITKLLGQGSYGQVFEIEREDYGTVYKAALKAITIPRNESEYKQIVTENQSEANATSYFRGFVEEMVKEFELMSKLKGHSNIVSYEDHKVIEHKDDVGWDILIRMELLTPLDEYLKQHPMDEDSVIRMGIDLCKALELCEKHGIVHRDIKPENIFVSENGDFKLGDFGIARVAEKSTGASTRIGTNAYMAPEIYRGQKYSNSVDMYSLGLVMYRLLNKNRLPFYPPYPEIITYDNREKAISERISGKPFPQPVDASREMTEVINKACAVFPAQRYRSPLEMRIQLQRLCGIETNEPIPTDDTQGVFGAPKNTSNEPTELAKIVCPVCQTVNPAKNKFCIRCGNALQDLTNKGSFIPAPPIGDGPEGGDEGPEGPEWPGEGGPEKKKGSKLKRILVFVILLLIACAGLAVYALIFYYNEPMSNGMTNAEGKKIIDEGAAQFESGEYEDAIKSLQKVPDDSWHYKQAQALLEDTTQAYVDDILNRVGQYVQNGEYDVALELLKNARKVVPDSTEFNDKYSETYNEQVGKIRDKAISDADQLVDAGDYPAAISTLRKAVELAGNEEELSAKLTATENEYKAVILNSITDVYNNDGYDAVISYLKSAMEILPDNADLNNEFDIWKERIPAELIKTEEFSYDDVTVSEGTINDNYGELYNGAIYGNGFIEYHVDSKYAFLTGKIIVLNQAKNYDTNYDDMGAAKISIYGDDILLYTKSGFTSKDEPLNISVDIKNIKFLKIVFEHAEHETLGFGTINKIALAEPIVRW